MLGACKPGGDQCRKNYYISGTVTDQLSNPVSGVTVTGVTHYDFEYPVSVTDALGRYEDYEGKYSDLGNSHYKFSKPGFQISDPHHSEKVMEHAVTSIYLEMCSCSHDTSQF